MADTKPSRILVFGGTGYIGKYLVEASVSMGHPNYVYARPVVASLTSEAKLKLCERFRSLGITIIEGTLEDHEKLVLTMKEVDVVISALAFPQVFGQYKIIDAISAAGNIKVRDFCRLTSDARKIELGLSPHETFLEKKRKIRRAIEDAGIPFTYVSVNCFGAYFFNLLLHPHDRQLGEVFIYGSGEAKAVFNYEEGIAKYTIRVADDPRAHNRLVIYRPQENIVSQLELVLLWEKKTGRRFKIVFVPEVELVRLSTTLPDPDNLPVSIIHSLFVRGDLMGFELEEDDIEASEIYPDLKFATVDQLLDIFLNSRSSKVSHGIL